MKTCLFPSRGIVAAFHGVSARMTSALVSVALIGGMASCTFDDTDLQNSIDDLTSRVEALENFQEQVQGDIASLQDIISKLNSSVTVNNVVDNGDGSWTINFSDGTSVTIRNGQDGEDGLTPPSITVVEEDGTYYWAYENADGTIKFILDDDGNKIPVSGEAPQVRINEDGYWEISTDGGKTWENTGVRAEGIENIGAFAFANTSGLETVVFPESIKSVGNSSFRSCALLSEVIGGSSLETVSEYAFCDCSSLENADFLSNAVSVGDFAFSATALASVSLDNAVKVGTSAFLNCTALKNVVIPDCVTEMGASAFSGCSSLENLSIGSGLTSIPDSGFSGCGLKSLVVPGNIKTIGNSAFGSCESLSELTIGEGVESIGNQSFRWCSSLTELLLPDSVTDIVDMAFADTGLLAVTMGSGVKNIGFMAFSNTPDLMDVTVMAVNPPVLGWFNFDRQGDVLHVPAESVEAYQADSEWGSSFTTIVAI